MGADFFCRRLTQSERTQRQDAELERKTSIFSQLFGQLADLLHDRLGCGINLLDQRGEMRASFCFLASATKSASFMVTMKASCSIFTRSAARFGGARNGRALPVPAKRNSIACLSSGVHARSFTRGTSLNSGFGAALPWKRIV